MKKVLYFTNQYPKVSHSFIRREIKALEKIGVEVYRVALGCEQEELVDSDDIEEFQKTTFILQNNQAQLIKHFILFLFSSPLRLFATLPKVLGLAIRDGFRIIPHMAYLLEAVSLLKLANEQGVEHIHVHFGTNPASVALLCRLLGGPSYSFTVHGPDELDRPRELSLNAKIAHAKFVVAITSYCRSQLYRWADYCDWEKIKIVHCTVDQAIEPNEVKPISNTKRFISIGRLSEQKGQMLLLQAINKLTEKGLAIELNLVGDGPMRGMLEEYTKQNNLQNIVHFLGAKSNDAIFELLDQSSALLLPSFAEGLPVVIMEAFSRGRPVVSTYIAGIPELVDEKAGWLIPAGDVDSLSTVIHEVVDSSCEKLLTMGLVGKSRVTAEHCSITEARKLQSFF